MWKMIETESLVTLKKMLKQPSFRFINDIKIANNNNNNNVMLLLSLNAVL